MHNQKEEQMSLHVELLNYLDINWSSLILTNSSVETYFSPKYYGVSTEPDYWTDIATFKSFAKHVTPIRSFETNSSFNKK